MFHQPLQVDCYYYCNSTNAASDAAAVPILLKFILKGYSKDNGIPTILLAANGFNGVISLTSFGVLMNVVFATNQSAMSLVLMGVLEVIGGVFIGCIVGHIVAWIWAWGNSHYWRFSLTLFISCIGLFAGKAVNMSGGGTLGVITIGIAMKARLQEKMLPVEDIFELLWTKIGQTLLFGILGAQVDLSQLTPDMCFAGAVVIAVALTFRFLSTLLCVSHAKGWSKGEKLFAGVCWCPKATVQAALSTVALDYVNSVRKQFDTIEEFEKSSTLANIVLTVAVLSILMTAPLFGALIEMLGPVFLSLPAVLEGNRAKEMHMTVQVKLDKIMPEEAPAEQNLEA